MFSFIDYNNSHKNKNAGHQLKYDMWEDGRSNF
jgi:hypothetical protein